MRISTTDLESFRRIIQTDYGREDELISRIEGHPAPASWQMKAGAAWHAALAGEPYTDFAFEEIHIERAREAIGPGLWEVKASGEVAGHTIVAKVDHVCGSKITENKAKFSQASEIDYEPQLQWRFYLLLHEATQVRYNLWSFKDPSEAGAWCDLRDVLSFSFWPYAGLQTDCERWVRLFADWAEAKNLSKFLQEKDYALAR